MSRQILGALGAMTVAISLIALVSVPLAGQAPTATTKTWTAPRTPDGQPDLQGVWNYSTLTPLQQSSDLAGKEVLTEAEAEAFERESVQRNNKDRRDFAPGTVTDVGRAYNDFWWDRGTKVVETRRTSLVVDPPDGRIPSLTPEARKKAAARAAAIGSTASPEGRAGGEDGSEGGVDGRGGRADGPEDRGLDERCITRSVPRLPGAYNNNYQIVQGPGYVAILQEMNYEIRLIPTDGRPHPPKNIRQWMGDSRGRWEGNTLVVETTNFTDRTNFRGSGDALRLVERFTRIDADTIDYQFTAHDPETWARSWTAAFPLTKTQDRLYEYACHEGNYGMMNLLRGARAEAKAAAAGGARKGPR